MGQSQRYGLFILQDAIRSFFKEQQFLDVLTPPLVENPGMETHIHPFQAMSARDQKVKPLYLHTSPEFHMKELLAEGFDKIFTMSYCFRDEPNSQTHRPQFIMLEWYRSQARYEQIMDDCVELIEFCRQRLIKKEIAVKEIGKVERKTVAEIFKETLDANLYDLLDRESLEKYIQLFHKDIHLPKDLSWEDLYFLLFLNKVEPQLNRYPALLLYEFPSQLAALSTIKESDPRVCERFEVYMNGVELCNCFNELTDPSMQRERFKNQAMEKKKLYSYQLPEPTILYSALDKGLPPSAGIALGVERLFMALTGCENPFWS